MFIHYPRRKLNTHVHKQPTFRGSANQLDSESFVRRIAYQYYIICITYTTMSDLKNSKYKHSPNNTRYCKVLCVRDNDSNTRNHEMSRLKATLERGAPLMHETRDKAGD